MENGEVVNKPIRSLSSRNQILENNLYDEFMSINKDKYIDSDMEMEIS